MPSLLSVWVPRPCMKGSMCGSLTFIDPLFIPCVGCVRAFTSLPPPPVSLVVCLWVLHHLLLSPVICFSCCSLDPGIVLPASLRLQCPLEFMDWRAPFLKPRCLLLHSSSLPLLLLLAGPPCCSCGSPALPRTCPVPAPSPPILSFPFFVLFCFKYII